MPLNTGYIEATKEDVVVRIYYDANQPAGPDQPLINGPRGYCLDMTNTSGKTIKLTVTGLLGTALTVNVGVGDPVLSGPTSGRSRTAAQMAAAGYLTRGSIGNFVIE